MANAEYFSIYSKSFHFPQFIPNQEQRLPTIPAGFEILDVGPFHWDDPNGMEKTIGLKAHKIGMNPGKIQEF